MPIKLIGTILLVVLVAVLTGFNLENKCNIWFFHTFKEIPVYAAIITSFLLGVVVTLPFTFGKKRMQKKLEKISAELDEKKKKLGEKIDDFKNGVENKNNTQHEESVNQEEKTDEVSKTSAKKSKAKAKKA